MEAKNGPNVLPDLAMMTRLLVAAALDHVEHFPVRFASPCFVLPGAMKQPLVPVGSLMVARDIATERHLWVSRDGQLSVNSCRCGTEGLHLSLGLNPDLARKLPCFTHRPDQVFNDTERKAQSVALEQLILDHRASLHE